MKYYIYISDTKVDMLYPQIPKPLLKRIASDLSIDLKLFGAEVRMPYRILCNRLNREGVKTNLELVFGFFCYGPLHKIRDGI